MSLRRVLRADALAVALALWSLAIWGPIRIQAQTQTPSPVQTVSAMAAKEMAARNQDNLYRYMSEEVSARTGGHRWTEKVVEINEGTLRRLIAVDGHPLTAPEAKAEEDRINDIVRRPDEFRRNGLAHKDDEAHAQRLLELLPKAFLITPAGELDGCARFEFRPNPAFHPSTYEERVAVAMAGTVSLKQPTNRLCSLQGNIVRPVEFGFGLLGRIEEGGHFVLERTPVDATHWKSNRISVHMQGHILLMKTLTREQEVRRTDVSFLPGLVSLQQAAQLIAP